MVKNNLADIVDVMVRAGYEVTVYSTQAPKDAVQKVREEACHYDRVVCSGGDGTLDEVVTGMMQSEVRVPIGYIPAGSTNDYGTSLGITKEMEQAAHIAAEGRPYAVDIGDFNGDNFVYIAAFGLFTEVSYKTPQEMKNVLGHAAYLLEATKQLLDIPSYRMQVEYEGNVIYDEFIYGMITNSKSVGGMTGIIPGDISLNDGVFEVNMVKNPRNPLELNEIVTYLTGLRKDTNMVYTFQTNDLKLTCSDKVPWTLDGEFGGDHEVVRIRNCHDALEIMVE